MNPEYSEKLKAAVDRWKQGAHIYMDHIACLIVPSRLPDQFDLNQPAPAPLSNMTDDDLKVVIEEGRRQIDKQASDLHYIRTRAQWLLTIMIAASAALTNATLANSPNTLVMALWGVGILLLTLAVLGTTSLIVVAARRGGINTALMGNLSTNVLSGLATSYTSQTTVGETTLATMLSVLHRAVFLALVGGYIGLVGVVIKSWP